ncbi:hypothetical protein SAMN05216223_12968 [Actinacidiphila yanglinensis]|uniref:Uncharacterized protein n=1 Tax=Actinacidiphila yanglinensis TaxID=310779 RepID=A0A1H6EAC1_9ACTN|nr:hypothetical protein [Actinacidiphila yanglinensis]SEG94183.1 hypothetical protein SAMN05216223_12968 [Actinacidiphila yanglinensis]
MAEKLARYEQYFARTVYDGRRHNAMIGDTDKLHWRTLFPPTGRSGTPQVAAVFTGMSRPALVTCINLVLELTADQWHSSYRPYRAGSDAIPLLVASLEDLTAHGPQGPTWHRAGANMPKRGLVQALDNTAE